MYAFLKLCILVGYIICGFVFKTLKGVLDQTGPKTTGKVDKNGVMDAALPLIARTLDISMRISSYLRPLKSFLSLGFPTRLVGEQLVLTEDGRWSFGQVNEWMGG